ncbi:MAG: Fe(3+) ABC transporter substrate-binding protein [Pseudomonadota bacterium]
MRSKSAIFASVAIIGLTSGVSVFANEVNIYSSRHYDSDFELYETFTEATGITVNRLEGEADELNARLQAEGAQSPADILLTVDAGRIWRADELGLLQSVESDVLNARIPEHLRDPEGRWYGLSMRARVIFYDKDRVANPPQTYADLADPAYEGQICIRTSSNIYNLSLMAAMIENEGEDAARDWAAGLLNNLARSPEGGDTDQLRGIVSGACDIAVSNSYYFARALSEDVEGLTGMTDNIGLVFPDQEGNGTHVNIAAGGIVTNAPNMENAIAFMEFLTTPEAQAHFANQNNELPVVAGAPIGEVVASLGEFKHDELNLDFLGANQARAQEIFNEVGFP